MADGGISFFDCADIPQELTLVIPAQTLVEEQSITVLSDRSDLSDTTASIAGYAVIVPALRRFTRWITVTQGSVCHAASVKRPVSRTPFRKTYLNSGIQVLRQSSILII